MPSLEKPRVYTVSQVNRHISSMFREDSSLNAVFVRGELSNVKYASSGHLYFSLKDESSQIRCAMWSSDVKKMKDTLENGESVTVFGQIAVYERDGTYQLYARAVRKDGSRGILYERFEALRKKLLDMGMFDPQYKKPLPKYVRTLGVVTARSGAAVRDIINIAKRRNPGIRIILYPATVQGDGAADTIVKGIETLDSIDEVDVIIVGRGGGSIEDLWAFNEESVAWAIWNCKKPVISAVGHETDTTIADFAADLRAPTPSAGAELAVADMQMVIASIRERETRLSSLMQGSIDLKLMHLKQYALRLRISGPEGKLQSSQQFLLNASERIDRALSVRLREALGLYERLRELMNISMQDCMGRAAHTLELTAGRLRAVSPLQKLGSGYAFIEDASGNAVSSALLVKEGDVLRIRLHDGSIQAAVLSIDTNHTAPL